MVNLAKVARQTPARVLLVGYPGAGKTGALCSLIDEGFKLRILAFDMAANFTTLTSFVKDKRQLDNVDIVYLEDELRSGPQYIEVKGVPSAFAKALKLMDHWTYTDDDGEVVDLGKSKDWGPDTVVVLDSLTAMGEAAKRRAMAMLNKTPLNSTQQMWGLAMQDQFNFLAKLLSSANRHHVVVTSHLKQVGPKEIVSGDDQVTKEIKERLVELVPTRLYPSALGQQLPPQIGQLFSTVLLAEVKYVGSKSKRVLKASAGREIDLKCPAVDLPAELDQSDGLLKVFEATTGGPDYWFGTNQKEKEVA